MKGPLQLKENRSVCSSLVKKIIPHSSVVHCFPFLTGELELELLREDRFIIAHTNNYVTYEFWRCVMTDPQRVAAFVDHMTPLKEKRIFYMLQRRWAEYKDPFVRSGIFFLLNQHSSSGLISSGEFVDKPISPSMLMRLKNFDAKNFHIQFDQQEDFLTEIEDISDSEYALLMLGQYHYNILDRGINMGYEQTNISHKAVLNFFNETQKKCVLVYQYHPRLLKEYKGHNIVMVNQYAQPTQRQELCKEVIIANFRTE